VTVAALEAVGHRLPDLCTEFFAFALQLSQSPDPGDGEQLRIRVNRLLEGVRGRAAQSQLPQHVTDAASYAMVALIDELVLTSQWPLKGAWLGRPLQMEHFNSFAAGEEFYRRLDSIRASSDPHKIDLLEIYLLCLCLGFKGKHGTVQGLEVIRVLKNELAEQIQMASLPAAPSAGPVDAASAAQHRKRDPKDLSPAWRPPPVALQVTKDLPVRVVVVACLALLVVVYGVLAALLADQVGTVLEGVSVLQAGE
jgi:type VI secretion system protein ImpK